MSGEGVLLTGATGFLGTHLARELQARGHPVTALGRGSRAVAGAPCHPWDLADPEAGLDALPDLPLLAHLAWEGLPRYQEEFHIVENLPRHLRFLSAMARRGLRRVFVAGTCFETGLREGAIPPQAPGEPVTRYAIAKDALRRSLAILAAETGIEVLWGRIFYLHGPGQGARSLPALLDAAIARGDERFPMSHGLQERDYLPVQEAAALIAGHLLGAAPAPGQLRVCNICSGRPQRVIDFVTDRIRAAGAPLVPEPGVLAVPGYEPAAFWGIPGMAPAEAATTGPTRRRSISK